MVKGLKYVPNFLCHYDWASLLDLIYTWDWCLDLKRRTQHYGYKYDYRHRSINESMKVGPIPEVLCHLNDKMISDGLLDVKFDQVIINEYKAGQSITPHIDCTPCFEDTICTLSLGSEYVMDFMNWKTKEKFKLLLEVGSLLILSGEARYDWTHGLKPQKGDRVSVTFRKVIL